MATERVALVRADGRNDGRAARSQRTRDAVVHALLDLLRGGNLRPTAREIAEQAGVSLRSVYVHFDDVEDLFCAAATQEIAALAAILEVVPCDGPIAQRLDAFIAQRVRLWEQLGPVGSAAALQEPFSASLARVLKAGRQRARAEVERVFAQELDGDENLTAAVDLIASASSWRELRFNQGLDAHAASAVLRTALERALADGAHEHDGGTAR